MRKPKIPEGTPTLRQKLEGINPKTYIYVGGAKGSGFFLVGKAGWLLNDSAAELQKAYDYADSELERAKQTLIDYERKAERPAAKASDKEWFSYVNYELNNKVNLQALKGWLKRKEGVINALTFLDSPVKEINKRIREPHGYNVLLCGFPYCGVWDIWEWNRHHANGHLDLEVFTSYLQKGQTIPKKGEDE